MSPSVLNNYSSTHKIEVLTMFLCCKFVKSNLLHVPVIMTCSKTKKTLYIVANTARKKSVCCKQCASDDFVYSEKEHCDQKKI